MSQHETPTSWDIALPFLISYGLIVVGLLGTWAVTRKFPGMLSKQIGGESRWDDVPDALKPGPLKDLIVWAVDAVASLSAVAAPGVGALIVLPQGANHYAALAYGIVFLANFTIFLLVMFGWDSATDYVAKFPKVGPITIVPIVAAAANTAALIIALSLA